MKFVSNNIGKVEETVGYAKDKFKIKRIREDRDLSVHSLGSPFGPWQLIMDHLYLLEFSALPFLPWGFRVVLKVFTNERMNLEWKT